MLTVMTHPFMPPIETATDPIHSAADMGQRWRAVMGPHGFSERLLWIGFVGPDRRLVKALSQVPLGPPRPRGPILASTMRALLEVLDGLKDGTAVALLLTRPGRGPISDADRRWATLITDAAAEFGVPIEPVFRANDESLVQVEPERELCQTLQRKFAHNFTFDVASEQVAIRRRPGFQRLDVNIGSLHPLQQALEIGG